MKAQIGIAFGLLAIIVVAGIWDIVAVSRGRNDDQVSVVLHSWSLAFPILPLIVGVLIGHIFWPVRR